MDQNILRVTLDCQRHFLWLKETLEANEEDNFRNEVPNVMDELARFRMWANNIGAANTGMASLDYRLRNTESLRKRFQTLLSDLSNILISGFFSVENACSLTW